MHDTRAPGSDIDATQGDWVSIENPVPGGGCVWEQVNPAWLGEVLQETRDGHATPVQWHYSEQEGRRCFEFRYDDGVEDEQGIHAPEPQARIGLPGDVMCCLGNVSRRIYSIEAPHKAPIDKAIGALVDRANYRIVRAVVAGVLKKHARSELGLLDPLDPKESGNVQSL